MPPQTQKHTEILRSKLALKGLKVADIGCGSGGMAAWMARQGADVIAIDPSEDQIERARSVAGHSNIRFEVAGAEALPLDDETLDAAVFFNSLHHIPTDLMVKGLLEALRTLRTGGTLYVAEPLAEGPSFELMQPIEDETEIRADARAALEQLKAGRTPPAAGFIEHFQYLYLSTHDSYERFRDSLIAVSPARKQALDEKDAMMRERFRSLGTETVEGGMAFVQPMRVDIFQKTAA
ncbi:MAG: class I SAM-dependent methyltransferase [Pseudomonadota bacterium]